MKCSSTWVRRICSEETLSNELHFINDGLSSSGYPDGFIAETLAEKPAKDPVDIARKKEIDLNQPFKRDCMSERLLRRLNKTVRSPFNAADLRCSLKTRPLIKTQNKDKLPRLTSSMLICRFRCACAAFYVGRTARQLSMRVKGHDPCRLTQGGSGTVSGAILGHLIGRRVIELMSIKRLKCYIISPGTDQNWQGYECYQ